MASGRHFYDRLFTGFNSTLDCQSFSVKTKQSHSRTMAFGTTCRLADIGVADRLSDHNFFSIWPLKPFQNAAALTALLPGSWISKTSSAVPTPQGITREPLV